MKRLKIFSIILLILSIVVCVGYEFKWSRGTDKLGPQISMDETLIKRYKETRRMTPAGFLIPADNRCI